MRALVDLGMRTYASWRADRTLRLGAGLAYYALFTLVPFIAITLALVEPLVGSTEIEEFVAARLASLGVDDPGAISVELSAELARNRTQASLGIVGAVSLFVSASLVFIALTDAVNSIWRVPVASGWFNSLRRRLIGFAMVLISCAAIVLSLAMNAVLSAATALIPGNVAILESLAPILGSGASWAGLVAVLALLFRYLAPRPLPWRGVLATAVFTATMLVLSTVLMGWYLREFGGQSIAGAFGAVVALLSWVYVEAQIVLAGVELTKALYPADPEASPDGTQPSTEHHPTARPVAAPGVSGTTGG